MLHVKNVTLFCKIEIEHIKYTLHVSKVNYEGRSMSEKIDKISVTESVKKFDAIKKDLVTDETKSKLKSLGIDASNIKTETEAQKIIKEAESAQANASHFQHPMGEVLKDAKQLAEKIGIRVESIDNVEKILQTIDKQLKIYEKQVVDDVGDERKDMVAGARREYRKIKADFEKSMAEQSKISANLDMMAVYNVVRS